MAKKPTTLIGKILAFLGSYWIAVLALLNLFALTLFGTLEQVDEGIFRVQKKYFESYFVFADVWGRKLFLFGGMTTMMVLTINLICGGLIRIRKSRRTIGVIIAHVGIVVMMVGGFIEHKSSVYGAIRLEEGQQGGEFYDYKKFEVAIWNADPDAGVQEFLIPEEHFDDLTGQSLRTFKSQQIPFDVVLSYYARHCTPREAVGVGTKIDAPVVDGFFLERLERLTEPEAEMPGVYVTVPLGGARQESTFLHWRQSKPWTFEAGGQTWSMAIRRKRFNLPFEIRLVDFVKDDHPGISMARSFSSDVVRIEKDGTEVNEHIRMNEPMRKDGLVVYQASFGPQNGEPGNPYSVLAVHRNPSDRIPWISVYIIAIGLLWTMADRLNGFLGKEARRAAKAEAASAGSVAGDDQRSAA